MIQCQVHLPRPLPWQRAIRVAPTRYKLLRVGRRAGKTVACCEALLLGSEAYPGALRRRGIYWWIAPDFTQATIATRFLRQMTQGFGVYAAGSKTFHLRNGSQVVIKTAENEKALRGEGLSGAVVDEAAFVKQSVFKDCLMPALKDKQGFGLLASTPNGFGWYHDLEESTRANPAWFHFSAPSWLSPWMSRPELEAEREILGSARFRQEYGAETVSMEGALFSPEWFQDILVSQLPSPCQRSVIAVDLSLGRIKSDYQAVVFLGWAQGRFQADIRLFRTSIETLCDEVAALYEQYQCQEGVIFEDNGFQVLAGDTFTRKYPQIPFSTVTNTVEKPVRIGRLAGPLSRGELRILDTPQGRQGLNQCRDYPVAEHDDAPDALEVAWRWFVARR